MILAEVLCVRRTYCAPGNWFVPFVTYGGPGFIHPGVDDIVNEEIDRCSAEIFGR